MQFTKAVCKGLTSVAAEAAQALWLGLLSLWVHVPSTWVLRVWVIVLMVQVSGKLSNTSTYTWTLRVCSWPMPAGLARH